MPSIKDIVVKKITSEEQENCLAWPIWQGDVSTFNWDYTQTETCLIIEGRATITNNPPTEDSIIINAGDLVIFPEALICIWKIDMPIRKHYQFS